MRTGILDFAAARIGRHVAAPGGLGGECVDLVELWGAALGAHHIPGNATDLYGAAPDTEWSRIGNQPLNHPDSGDIVVWGPAPAVGIGAYGHCAIVLAADAWWLLTLDQNWPPTAPVAVILHPYTGVRGWIRRLPPG